MWERILHVSLRYKSGIKRPEHGLDPLFFLIRKLRLLFCWVSFCSADVLLKKFFHSCMTLHARSLSSRDNTPDITCLPFLCHQSETHLHRSRDVRKHPVSEEQSACSLKIPTTSFLAQSVTQTVTDIQYILTSSNSVMPGWQMAAKQIEIWS